MVVQLRLITASATRTGSESVFAHFLEKVLMPPSNEFAQFIRAFQGVAKYRHRYEVFKDFITTAGIAIQNSMRDFIPRGRFENLEAEYLSIVSKYTKEDVNEISRLFGHLVHLLDHEPRDVIGQLYMALDLGNENVGQFFTPPELSDLIALTMCGDLTEQIKTKPFITLQEPACGAGGMVLSFVKMLHARQIDVSKKLWVHATDIDRTAALMCYIQMSLWHVPGLVTVGNSLLPNASYECFYTPAHILGNWEYRLRHEERSRTERPHKAVQERDCAQQAPIPIHTQEPNLVETTQPKTIAQLDFGF